jgi:hypothetical protein
LQIPHETTAMAAKHCPQKTQEQLSLAGVTGVAAIFFFLVFMFLRLVAVPHEYRMVSVDLYESAHASPQVGALKKMP